MSYNLTPILIKSQMFMRFMIYAFPKSSFLILILPSFLQFSKILLTKDTRQGKMYRFEQSDDNSLAFQKNSNHKPFLLNLLCFNKRTALYSYSQPLLYISYIYFWFISYFLTYKNYMSAGTLICRRMFVSSWRFLWLV